MSRRRRSKRPTSKRGQQAGSKAAKPANVVTPPARPAGNRGLLSAIGIMILVAIGSYYWFNSEPPPVESLDRNSQADFYRKVLASDPENNEAQYNLGLVLQSQGKVDEAVAHYRRAIAISGENAGYHNNLGAALAGLGKFDKAVEHFNQAISIDPQNAESEFNLGNALMSQEKIEEAIGHYRQAIKLKPDYGKAHNNLAVALKQTGHLDEAFRHRYEAMRLETAQKGAASQDSAQSE